ncbi:MAG: hypothetical protein AB1571_03955 [Nanoarchaeota archaeon]
MLHKKAVSMHVVELILIVLVLSLVIFFVVYIFKPGIETTSSKSACEQSVLLKAKAKAVPGVSSKVDLQCETTKIEIDEINEKSTKKIADAMYDCWGQFGEGKVDFLSDWDFGGVDTFCFICSKIEFDASIKENKIDLGIYLNENNPPLHNVSYSVYLTGTKGAFTNIPEIKEITADKPLYVLFFANKGSDLMTRLKVIGGGTATGTFLGCAGGLIVGSAFGGIGVIPGFVIGCKSGAAVGAVISSVVSLGEETKYYPGLYVTNDEKDVVGICGKS